MKAKQIEIRKNQMYDMTGLGGRLYVHDGGNRYPVITDAEDFEYADTTDGYIFRIPLDECRERIFLRAFHTDKEPLRCPGVAVAEGVRAVAYVDVGGPMYAPDITQGILDLWDVSFREILGIARENMLREFSTVPLNDKVCSMLKEDFGDDTEMLECLLEGIRQGPTGNVMVLFCGTYGAGALAAPEVLESAMPEGKYFVLPSSVYELLLVPDDGAMSPEEAAEMVAAVNLQEVAPEEQLVDGAFLYHDGTLTLLEN